MKLLVLSDLHLDSGTFRVPEVEVDAVILAGDIAATAAKALRWAQRPGNFGENTPIIFVPGNHEFYGGVMDTALADMRQAASNNVHALSSGEVVLQGVRFLGTTLWTDFALGIETEAGAISDVPRAMKAARWKMNDYKYIRVAENVSRSGYSDRVKRRKRRLTPEDTAALHLTQRQWLAGKLAEPFEGRTVVVTHHAPHRGSLDQKFASHWISTAYANELPENFFDVPIAWIHGHTHESVDYRVGNTRVVCNPRGYASAFEPELNPAFNPGLVIEV